MSSRRQVAVLGAGIMGSATALHLAARGARVVLFDREAEPLRGASRWNEGKIHLGFLYAADPSLGTARSLLAEGLDFAEQVRRLTGFDVRTALTPADDVYLVHRDSVAAPDAVAAYFERLAELVTATGRGSGYLTDVSSCRVERLSAAELERVADPGAVAAGFRVPERSVDTSRVADAFVAALAATPAIEPALGRQVEAVARDAADRLTVVAGGEAHGPFDAVVNALWEGRPAVDRSVGHRPDSAPQHRYRVSLFVRASTPLDVPSAVVAVGPFGDMKNYGDRSFYVSWYPAGLLARAEAVDPPPVSRLSAAERDRVAAATFAGLGAVLPAAREVERAAEEVQVRGGWVYSQGSGLLDDPGAAVHRRDRHGISADRGYFSVDTGKYSVAPTRAEELARRVLGTD